MHTFKLKHWLIVGLVAISNTSANGQSLQTKISSYGLALPKDNVTLRSNIESHVEEILVEDGQFVRKGQLLVKLHCASALARQEIAELAAQDIGPKMSAMAELQFTRSNFQKIQELFHDKAVNDREFRESAYQVQRAKANLRTVKETKMSNQARLKLATAELDEHFIRAPFDGQIVDLKVSPGNAVNSNTDLLQIISSNTLRVDIYLSFQDTAELSVGQFCLLEVNAPMPGRQLEAKVVFQSPMIEATTGARRVTLEIDNRELRLPAGFTVRLVNTPNELAPVFETAGK